jgi:hypothetical protein
MATIHETLAGLNLCTKCGIEQPELGCRWCLTCRQRFGSRVRVWRQANREAAIKHYGGICMCCGYNDIRFLTIDHICGNGKKHRKELGNPGGNHFFKILKDQGYPTGYQVLCWNCNCAKSTYGKCPHQTDKISK